MVVMKNKTVIVYSSPDVSYPTGEYPDNSPKVITKLGKELTSNEKHFLSLQYRILQIAGSQNIAVFILDQLKQGISAYDIAVQTPCSLNDILLIESLVKELNQVEENIDLDKIEKPKWSEVIRNISKDLIANPKNKKNPKSFQDRRSFKSVKNIGSNYKK